MSHEEIVQMIQDYIDELNARPPERNWPEYWFKQKSYSIWVGSEILKKVKAEPHSNPLDVIEKFVNELDYYSTLSKNYEFRMIFSIAKDTAEDIGDMFV